MGSQSGTESVFASDRGLLANCHSKEGLEEYFGDEITVTIAWRSGNGIKVCMCMNCVNPRKM